MRKQTIILALVLLAGTLLVMAAKPEPLTYKSGGRRYVIAMPDSQLWSQSEIARSVQWHEAGKLFIGGKEIRQARLRGQAGDRTNRNYLVTVIRTGKRLAPSPSYYVRPEPWTHTPAPPMPTGAAPAPSKAKVAAKAMGAPLTVTLTWSDVAGAVAGGWGNGPLMMPDGGPRFWTVSASRDLQAWRTVAVVDTNRATIGAVWPAEYYRVNWRGEGEPAEVVP